MAKLKPCPFCKSDAELIRSDYFVWAMCTWGCCHTEFVDSETEAIAAWNRRKPKPT